MGFEIEKKYRVGNYEAVREKLNSDYGTSKKLVKTGFWFAEDFGSASLISEITKTAIHKNSVEIIKNIGEFEIPIQDFQYVRIRFVDQKKILLTFKMKMLVNKIEQNTEYEYELEQDKLEPLLDFFKNKLNVFYYNKKTSEEYKKGDLKIELSTFNDLNDAYLEVELTGDNQKELTERLEKELLNFQDYQLREEERSYAQLSSIENKDKLKNKKIVQYSKDIYPVLLDAKSVFTKGSN